MQWSNYVRSDGAHVNTHFSICTTCLYNHIHILHLHRHNSHMSTCCILNLLSFVGSILLRFNTTALNLICPQLLVAQAVERGLTRPCLNPRESSSSWGWLVKTPSGSAEISVGADTGRAGGGSKRKALRVPSPFPSSLSLFCRCCSDNLLIYFAGKKAAE